RKTGGKTRHRPKRTSALVPQQVAAMQCDGSKGARIAHEALAATQPLVDSPRAMDVVSTCPLRVAAVVWQSQAGAWTLTVVCKAPFQLLPGVPPPAGVREAPAEDDGYWDDDEVRSLHVPSDLVPFKARADVLLVGHAFAPAGQAVRSIPVRLAVGKVDK